MEQQRIRKMRKDLIRREIETTPWPALLELAVKKISMEVESLKARDVQQFMIERLQRPELDLNQARSQLVEHIIKASNKNEIIEHVRQALQAEYDGMEFSDVEMLHRLFIADGGSFNTKPLKLTL